MIIDTHSHLQFDAYDADRDEVIKRTLAENIQCINVGCSLASSKAAVELAKKQKDVFLQQIALSKDLQLPVIIHCRKAHDEMIEILKDQNLRGVIHCFTGTF